MALDKNKIVDAAQKALLEAIPTSPRKVSPEKFAEVISAGISSAIEEYDRQKQSD